MGRIKSWKCGATIQNQGYFHKKVCVWQGVGGDGDGGRVFRRWIWDRETNKKMFITLYFKSWCSENCGFIQNPTAGYWWNKYSSSNNSSKLELELFTPWLLNSSYSTFITQRWEVLMLVDVIMKGAEANFTVRL